MSMGVGEEGILVDVWGGGVDEFMAQEIFTVRPFV